MGKEVNSHTLGSWKPSMQLPMLAPTSAEGQCCGRWCPESIQQPLEEYTCGPETPLSRAKATEGLLHVPLIGRNSARQLFSFRWSRCGAPQTPGTTVTLLFPSHRSLPEVPACSHPTCLVNREESLRENVHSLLSFQQRNKARKGPSPFCVCACMCMCVHEVIVLGKNLSQAASPSMTKQQPGANLCFVASCEQSSPSALSGSAVLPGLCSWDSCLQPERWGNWKPTFSS